MFRIVIWQSLAIFVSPDLAERFAENNKDESAARYNSNQQHPEQKYHPI